MVREIRAASPKLIRRILSSSGVSQGVALLSALSISAENTMTEFIPERSKIYPQFTVMLPEENLQEEKSHGYQGTPSPPIAAFCEPWLSVFRLILRMLHEKRCDNPLTLSSPARD